MIKLLGTLVSNPCKNLRENMPIQLAYNYMTLKKAATLPSDYTDACTDQVVPVH